MPSKGMNRLFTVSFILAAIVCTPASAVLAGTSRKSTVQKILYTNNRITIYVKTGSHGTRPKYKYSTLSGNRFYIDILNSVIEKKLNYTPKNGPVKKIVRNQFNTSTSRVVLHLASGKITPSVRYLSNPARFIVDLNGGKPTAPLRKFNIVIDPGHGGRDPGAIGPNGTKEKYVTLDIARKLEKYLKEQRSDVNITLTRRQDVYISKAARKKIARSRNADLFISIHTNGSSKTHLNQTEIYYYDSRSFTLAKLIKRELLSELKQRDGGVRKFNYAVIRRNPAKFGSVLVESDYLTNINGEKRLRTDSHQQAIAKAIGESIDSFLNTKQ